MSWRTVIISSQSKLDYRMGYLVVRGAETQRVLLEEISVLVLETPAISLTGCLIEALTENKTKVIFCDSRRNPVSELVPHHGSHDSSAKIRTQISWKNETKAVIWREIVSEKIRKQAGFLNSLGKKAEAQLLSSYVEQVELADASNREGHAAKVYFNALFGMDFTRSAPTPVNAALNYGYSILLSQFNREISANGYLTQLGIFHGNMFNHFNLGSDLMEPFRIIVDRKVFSMKLEKFEKEEKHQLWGLGDIQVEMDGTRQTLPNAIRMYTKSVLDAIADEDASEIRFYENTNEDCVGFVL